LGNSTIDTHSQRPREWAGTSGNESALTFAPTPADDPSANGISVPPTGVWDPGNRARTVRHRLDGRTTIYLPIFGCFTKMGLFICPVFIAAKNGLSVKVHLVHGFVILNFRTSSFDRLISVFTPFQ